jgi:transposase InsO family protein
VSGRRVFWQIGDATPPSCYQENTVTAQTHSIKRKLSLLQLADELGNVARACKIMGYHRDTFYEVRRAFQTGGVAALVESKRGSRGPHPNRVAPEVEAKVLDYCLKRPTHGAQRVSNELRLAAVEVSPSGVRGVWLRNDLETRYKRLMRLERESRDNTTFVLTDEQVRLLERHSPDFRCRHVESSAPGELLNQDTFYWGTLKGVGKVYVQVVVDTFCSLAFAKCYSSKMPITACDLLYERVLPFYDALGVPVKAILTDNGREFCGKAESHPYELLLGLEDIEHRNTKVRSPRTNGFVERMNRTLLDECFRVKGRETFYIAIDEIQHDLDEFMAHYNLERSHQGYRLGGRTPAQALADALRTKLKKLPNLRFPIDANDAPQAPSTTHQENAADTTNA